MAVYKEDFNNERRDKERALSEKDSLMKQTTTLLNDLKAVQERVCTSSYTQLCNGLQNQPDLAAF